MQLSISFRSSLPVLLALLLPAAFAGANSTGDSNLANVRLREENARLLQEIAKLRAQLAESQHSQVLELAQMTTPEDALLEDDEDCSSHCHGDCGIEVLQIDKHCRATADFTASTQAKIVSVGTSTHPKWDLYNIKSWKPGARVVGSIDCPCSASNGSPMDAPTALSHIIGQMGAMGLDVDIAKKIVQKKIDKFGHVRKGAEYVAALGYTAVIMMNCWQRTCAPSENLLDALSLTDLLQDEDGSKVGWDCG